MNTKGKISQVSCCFTHNEQAAFACHNIFDTLTYKIQTHTAHQFASNDVARQYNSMHYFIKKIRVILLY